VARLLRKGRLAIYIRLHRKRWRWGREEQRTVAAPGPARPLSEAELVVLRLAGLQPPPPRRVARLVHTSVFLGAFEFRLMARR